MKHKKELIILSLIAIAIIGILSGASYAYFQVQQKQGQETVIESGTMALTLENGATITADNLIPGEYIEKEFTVKNTGTLKTGYDIYLSEVVNTFVNQSDLVYEIISSNGYNTSNQVQVPNTETKIINNYNINPLEEHKYILKITYKLTNENQNDNMGRTFIAKININEYKTTNNIIISFDNNGGEGDATPKILSVGDTYGTLPIPTREGYTFEGWSLENELNIINSTTEITNNNNHTLKANWVTTLINNKVDYDYTGDEQVFIAPSTGIYKLETWGAQGGVIPTSDINSGYGGYSVGIIFLEKNEKLYVVVGGQGEYNSGMDLSNTTANGGYNGGGTGVTHNSYTGRLAAGGGGATHIATENGLLSDLNIYKGSLSQTGTYYISDKILIVSGGGAGNWYFSLTFRVLESGSGGGFIGGLGRGHYPNFNPPEEMISGGTQLSTGSLINGYEYHPGNFGMGANITGGAGGGFYGGAAGHYATTGGSGYIASSRLLSNSNVTKHMYCYNCEISNDTETKTLSDGLLSCHNVVPTTDCAKEGNGYARITFME